MDLQNGVLTLSLHSDNDRIQALVPQVLENIDQIKEVVFKEDQNSVASCALFSFLRSIKKEKESIKIDMIDKSNYIKLFGHTTFTDER